MSDNPTNHTHGSTREGAGGTPGFSTVPPASEGLPHKRGLRPTPVDRTISGGERASNVRYLPAAGDRTALAPIESNAIDPADEEVLEGEIVTAREYSAMQRRAAIERYRGYQRDVVTVARVAKTVVTHDRTKTVVRHALAYPVAGVGVVWRRWRDAHGGNRYERQMRAAEAAGDQEALRYWQEADVAEKQRRHDRVMDWIQAPGQWIKAAMVGVAGLCGFLLVLGVILALNSGNLADVVGPIVAVFEAVAFVVWFLTAYGVFLIAGGTAATVFYLYSQGRRHAEVPSWLTAPTSTEGDVMDGLPDEGTIVNALRNLNIPGFKAAVKEGWRIRFRMPPTIDGKGWRAQLDLPPACPVEEIVKRKTMLAHNLLRYPIEVWPTEPQAGVLDLWVAKPGVLSGPVEPWPLLADLDTATADYFAGVPAGVTIKGDVVRGRLSEANYAVGGMMGSGKSSLVICLVCGAMLDPLVDIDIVVMAENADYDPMKPRLRSLVTGAGEETVARCLEMLYALYEEISVRGKALREHDARAVTRELAAKDARLRPRIMVIDECQNLFIGEHGKAAIEVTTKLMSTARKYAITLMFLTPEPSKDALPRKLITIASNKACFAIGDHQANDAVLGSGSYKSGISAVGLTPKTDEGPGDVGTCMQRGFTAKPGLLRSFFVGQNEVHAVTERALQLREQAAVTPAVVEPTAPEVEPLDDIAAVLAGHTRMRTQDVLQRLTERNRARYASWTFADLTAYLTPYGAEPRKVGGVMNVRTALVTAAIAERDENQDDDPDPQRGGE
jgi:S-DNA-T family DNA segregation ATPase FtsK/SpoIIIE